MGILQLLSKPKEKKSPGVCVPEAYREKHKVEEKARVEEPAEKLLPIISSENAFMVSGIFAVHDSIMLQGEMLQGSLKVGSKIEISGKKLKVADILVDKRPAEKINQGQRGALFLKAKSAPAVRVGDILEF